MRLLRLRSILWLAVVLTTPPALGHAKPGAHADVRFSVTRSAVRMEALMNLRFTEGLVNWSRSVRDEVAEPEESVGRAALLEYFGSPRTGGVPVVVNQPNVVTIDGIAIQPVVVEFRIVRPAPETRPGFVEVAQAQWQQVLMVLDYPCKTPPRTVSLVWGSYPHDFLATNRDLAPISDIEAILIAEGETRPLVFREREPEYIWHASATPLEARFLRVPPAVNTIARTLPGLSLGFIALGLITGSIAIRPKMGLRSPIRGGIIVVACLGAAVLARPFGRVPIPLWLLPAPSLPQPAEALAVFQPLHANIYRAFDYTAESEIYDALARSVDGPLLEKTYDDIYRSLILQEEGGALCRVKAVQSITNIVEAIRLNPILRTPELTVNAQWRVEGVVYHWGHSHSRINQYRARYIVAATRAGWRIVGVEPLEQQRVETQGSSAPATP